MFEVSIFLVIFFIIKHLERGSYCSVLLLQLSMWRCTDELRVRAHELHRSSKRDAKHYIGMCYFVLNCTFKFELNKVSDPELVIPMDTF